MSEIKYFTLKFSKENENDFVIDCCFDPNETRTYPAIVPSKRDCFDIVTHYSYPETFLQHVKACVKESKHFGYKFEGFVRGTENELEKLPNLLFLYKIFSGAI